MSEKPKRKVLWPKKTVVRHYRISEEEDAQNRAAMQVLGYRSVSDAIRAAWANLRRYAKSKN